MLITMFAVSMACRTLFTVAFILQHVAAQLPGTERITNCGNRYLGNAPSGTKCNVKGTLSSPQVLAEWVAKAPYETPAQLLDDCRVCITHPSCHRIRLI